MRFRVVIAEVATGIVCNADGSRHLAPVLPALDFDTLADAESYSRRALSTMPGYEFAIYDGGNLVTVLRSDMALMPPDRG
jgi:hypothetical protein